MDMATNDDDRRIFELIFSRQTAAYPFAAPPDVPKAKLEILRKAFDATMKDKDYLADAKRSSLEIDPTSGEEIDAIVASLFNTPDAVITRTKKVLRDGEAATVQR
jgi:tripartite-type tricarboxylate transporter receptor subunit TctC